MCKQENLIFRWTNGDPGEFFSLIEKFPWFRLSPPEADSCVLGQNYYKVNWKVGLSPPKFLKVRRTIKKFGRTRRNFSADSGAFDWKFCLSPPKVRRTQADFSNLLIEKFRQSPPQAEYSGGLGQNYYKKLLSPPESAGFSKNACGLRWSCV